MSALTPEQLSIVHHQQGHARVIAVAGAGKTTTLVHFIQQRLLAGSNPKRMLVLMYNKAAQTDFQIKLQQVVSQSEFRTPLPDVRTFHALGFKIYHRLISQGHLPGIQQDLINAGEIDGVVWRLLQQVAASQGLEDTRQDILSQRKKWVEPAVAFIDLVKSDLLSAGDMFEESELPQQCQIFIETFERFEQWRKEHNRITFSDMLYDPCMLFKQRPDIAEQFSGHMEWILVDEYQDVNGIQQFLLQILHGAGGYQGNGQVMVIGDADQTIYEFRGSKPEYITKEFEKAFNTQDVHGEVITTAHTSYQLPHTFRYGHKLSLLANQVIGENQDREDVLCLSHPTTPNTRIHLQHHGDYSQQVLTLLKELAEKRPLEDVAILNRLWGISAPIELALLQEDMPYQLDHSQTVLDRFELQVFWILFEIASDNFKLRNRRERKAAWLTLLTQPFPKVKRALLEDMAESISQHDGDLSQALWEAIPKDISKWQRQQLEDRGQVIEAAEMASIGKNTAAHVAKSKSGFGERELKAWQLAQQYINATDFYEGIKDSAFSAQQIEDRSETIKAFVRFLKTTNRPANQIYAYLNELKERHKNKQSSGVRITSIHKAKGLEWPVVIIPALSARYYPYEAEGTFTTKSSEESERRLFYVAMTRAKEDLYLIAPPTWNSADKNKKTQAEQQQTKDWPSKFLREADFELCQQVGELIEVGEVLSEPKELAAIQVKKSQNLLARYSEKIQFEVPVKLILKREKPDSTKGFKSTGSGISPGNKYELEDDDAEYQKGQWLVHGKLGKGRVIRDEKQYVTIYFSADKKERKLDKKIAGPWLSED